MEDEVGRFRHEFVVRLDYCCERNLEAFFANLLRNPLRPFGEEACGVAALRAFGDSLFDDALQRGDEGQALTLRDRRIAETRFSTLVTHRAERPGRDEQGVAITVGANLIELEKVA